MVNIVRKQNEMLAYTPQFGSVHDLFRKCNRNVHSLVRGIQTLCFMQK